MTPIATDWSNFFVAELGASAALTGFIVVAISVNLSRILAHAHLPGRAAEALISLAGALVLTSLGLVPNQPAMLLGAEALLVGLVAFAAPLRLQLRFVQTDIGVSRSRKVARILMGAAASLPFAIGGILLMCGWSSGLYWLAGGVIASLVAGIWGVWILLIEILR
jgi:hypothetical protein